MAESTKGQDKVEWSATPKVDGRRRIGIPRKPRTAKPALKTDGPNDLSRWVIDRRAELDISQAQLAGLMQHSQPWVSLVETGANWDLSYSSIRDLAVALQVMPDAVLTLLDSVWSTLKHEGVRIPQEGSGEVLIVKAGGFARVAEGAVVDDGKTPNHVWSAVDLQPIDTSLLLTLEDSPWDPPQEES